MWISYKYKNVSYLFVFLLLSFMSSLYILNNSPLLAVSFANIFSQSVIYLLILLILAFAVQKFLIVMKCSLSMTSFMDLAFGVVFKEFSSYQTSLVAQLVKSSPAMQETWVWPLGWEDPLEKGKATHSSILA